jgi:hypothetical protein
MNIDYSLLTTFRRLGMSGITNLHRNSISSLISSLGRANLAKLDSANWRRRKGQFSRRDSSQASSPQAARTAYRASRIANASCAFLLSNGATASHFAVLAPP